MRTRNPNYGRARDGTLGRVGALRAGSSGVNISDESANVVDAVTDISLVGLTVADLTNGAALVSAAGRMTTTYGGGKVQTVADAGVAIALDLSAYHVFDLTLTTGCTISLTNLPDSGVEGFWYVILRQGGTGSYTVTFADAFVNWQDPTTGLGGGSPPTLFTAVGALNVIGLATVDGASIGAWDDSSSGGSSLTIKDEGTPLATAATSIDFVGAGVVASGATGAKTVTIPGGPSLGSTATNVAAVGVASSGGSASTASKSDHAHALTYHDEPLTDGASNFIFDGGDIVVVTGVPN